VFLEADGYMLLGELLSFSMMKAMSASEQDIEAVLADGRREGKQRFCIISNIAGDIDKIKATQGHSGKAAQMIDLHLHLERCYSGDSRLAAKYMLHETGKNQVRSILAHGLLPGGLKGQRRREHVHLVARIAGTGECAGVRGGTDTIIRVDMNQFLEDGGIAYWSATEVLLTEGMILEDSSDPVGIAPR
jgi:RNA:NAD 2'-phosphotransferase (TPT1/KptA family)